MGISIRAYATHRGVSHTAVRKAIKSGRITTEPDGTIDPTSADAHWNTRTRPGQGSIVDVPEDIDDYATSRALRESYEAKLKKIEYEKACGLLVSREEVTSKIFTLARGSRDRLLQIPRRMAAQLAAESDQHKIESLLTQSMREALADLETLHDSDSPTYEDMR